MNGSLTTTALKKPHPFQLVGGAQRWNRLTSVPHPRVVDKNLGGISWGWGVPAPDQAPQPRVPVPGRSVPTTSGCKNQQELSQWKKLLDPQAVPLKEPTHGLTYLDSLPLNFSNRVVAWKAPVVYREELKCLESKRAEAIVPLPNPPPTKTASWCHIWDFINQATCLTHLGDSQRRCPTQLIGLLKLLFHFTTS